MPSLGHRTLPITTIRNHRPELQRLHRFCHLLSPSRTHASMPSHASLPWCAWVAFFAMLLIHRRIHRRREESSMPSPPQQNKKQTTINGEELYHDGSSANENTTSNVGGGDDNAMAREQEKAETFIKKHQGIIPVISTAQKRFPWEPRPISELNSKVGGDEEIFANEKSAGNKMPSMAIHIPNAVPSDAQAQLKFLASMTFANGGLRQPSCPCCR